MKKVINVEFDWGEIVYLKTDRDQRPFIVVSYLIDNSNAPLYKLCSEGDSSYHYAMEISKEKDILLKTSS